MNYSELLQLAKGWGNFISDRMIIWRLPKKEMNSTKRIIGNTRQIPVKLGTEILDSVNDLENAMSDIGMRICKIVMNCQTEEEYALVDQMVYAFAGKTLEQLLKGIRKHEK